MCYSKEVSLVVGSVIASGCGYSWWKYVYKSTKGRLKKAFTNKRLISFFKYVIIGLLCIGGHQLMEFLAIETGSQLIYKLGLIVSISSMYFLIRSLEVLSKLFLGSKVVALIIIFLSRFEKVFLVFPIYHLITYIFFVSLGIYLIISDISLNWLTLTLIITGMVTSIFEIIFSIYLLRKRF